MSDSLQDQLVALGLAKKEQAKKRKQGKAGHRAGPGTARRKKKGARKRAAGTDVSLEKAYRIKAQSEKTEKEKEREAKQAEDLRRRRINGQIRDIVERHARNDKDAEIKRNFLYKGRIRNVLVTSEQLKAVNAGELGIVYLSGRYFLLSPEHTAAVRAISPEHVPELGECRQPLHSLR